MKRNISNAVKTVLEALELHYSHDGCIYHFGISDEMADFTIRIIAEEERDLLMIIGYYPVKVPEENMDTMCRAINTINYSISVGAFVIDPEDGEIAFRIAQNTEGGAISGDAVRMCLMQVISHLTDNYQEVMETLFGGSRMNFSFAPEKDATLS